MANTQTKPNQTKPNHRWASDADASVAHVRAATVELPDGHQFRMADYVLAQRQATMTLRHVAERAVGAATFVEAWLDVHKPHKRQQEERDQLEVGSVRARTLKSFYMQEAESRSRDAKVAWCAARKGTPCYRCSMTAW